MQLPEMIISLYNLLKRRWMNIKLRGLNPKNVAESTMISAFIQEYQSDNINPSLHVPDMRPWVIETNKLQLKESMERLTASNENLTREFQLFKSQIEHQMNSVNEKLNINDDPSSE